ncbi:MAG TPA: periplasmic heavy metal sensor [Terriglobales bacterium]|nr:periplasmic heavy metal sensor [Terriglobales bacterium]
MRTSSFFLILILLAAGVSVAQTDNQAKPDMSNPKPRMRFMPGMPGMPGFSHDWWRNSELAQQIGLNEQQKEQLNQVFSSHRSNLVQLRGNVEIEEGKLHDLFDQDRPQQDQVLAEMTQLQSARNALEKEFTIMTLAFRNVLTPDQWKQLQSLAKDKMRPRFHRRGAEGPDGPPPPQ